MGLIQQGAERLRLSCIQAGRRDASKPYEGLGQMDRVLCDVPCSGYGVIRRKPEIRYKPLSSVKELPSLQYAILENGAALVKPGGLLVYATCTLNPKENGQVALRFLEEHPEFEPSPFSLPGVERLMDEPAHTVTLLPINGGSDGFFRRPLPQKRRVMKQDYFQPRDLKSKTLAEIQSEFKEMGLPKFRALPGIPLAPPRRERTSPQMSDLSKALREELSQKYEIAWAEVEQKRVSKDGTVKYLFRLPDGEHVESVLMHYHHGTSICISTQVGCKMNCSFCATGQSGFARNLSPSEILSQVQSASFGQWGADLAHCADGHGGAP